MDPHYFPYCPYLGCTIPHTIGICCAGGPAEESVADLAMFGSGLVLGQTLGTDYGL